MNCSVKHCRMLKTSDLVKSLHCKLLQFPVNTTFMNSNRAFRIKLSLFLVITWWYQKHLCFVTDHPFSLWQRPYFLAYHSGTLLLYCTRFLHKHKPQSRLCDLMGRVIFSESCNVITCHCISSLQSCLGVSCLYDMIELKKQSFIDWTVVISSDRFQPMPKSLTR